MTKTKTFAPPREIDALANDLYAAVDTLGDVAFLVKENGIADRWRHHRLAFLVAQLKAVTDKLNADFGMTGATAGRPTG